MIVGLLHPGEMGSAVGRVLQAGGHEVLWASEGRSEATRSRAESFRDAGTVRSLAGEAELILSICPPHAALDVARALNGFDGIYVDANAISPAHALEIAALHPRFVDGGIVGGPPREPGTKLYLSGSGRVRGRRAVRRLDARAARRCQCLGRQDGLRGVVEGHDRHAARHS